jgi:hypothetical protein
MSRKSGIGWCDEISARLTPTQAAKVFVTNGVPCIVMWRRTLMGQRCIASHRKDVETKTRRTLSLELPTWTTGLSVVNT